MMPNFSYLLISSLFACPWMLIPFWPFPLVLNNSGSRFERILGKYRWFFPPSLCHDRLVTLPRQRSRPILLFSRNRRNRFFGFFFFCLWNPLPALNWTQQDWQLLWKAIHSLLSLDIFLQLCILFIYLQYWCWSCH